MMGGGQVLAPGASQAPLLIQQPGALQGQQMIVLRPSGPNMQTLLPMGMQGGVQGVQGMPGQQIMMVQAPQQPQQQQAVVGGQPQVKLITPQVSSPPCTRIGLTRTRRGSCTCSRCRRPRGPGS